MRETDGKHLRAVWSATKLDDGGQCGSMVLPPVASSRWLVRPASSKDLLLSVFVICFATH